MRNSRFMIVLLAIFIIASMIDLSAQPFGKGRFRGEGRGMKKICSALNLSKEQVAKMESLKAEHAKRMIDLRADVQKARLEKRNLMKSSTIDKTKVLAADDAITAKAGKIRSEVTSHKLAMLEIFTPEQRAKFEELKQDRRHHVAMNKMQFRGRRGQGPRFNCDGNGPQRGQGDNLKDWN